MKGIRYGKFISPHLIRYNERICINNVQITDEEISTILEYFAENGCDFVVLETGLRRKG